MIPDFAAAVPDSAVHTEALALPAIFVDAGDVSWLELEPSLRRELAVLQPGEVLELKSGDPATLMTLPGWCAGEGLILHTEPGAGCVSFWIGRM